MKITKEQLLAWLGSDATKDTLVSLLLEIANQEYEVDALRSDIMFYERKIELPPDNLEISEVKKCNNKTWLKIRVS